MGKRKWTTDLIKKHVEENHPNTEIVGYFEYNSPKQRITVRCKLCGHTREVDFAKLTHYPEACRSCSGLKKKTIDEVRKDFLSWGFILTSTEYKSNSEQLEFYDYDGYKYNSSYANIKKCKSADKFHVSNKFSIENIQLWLDKNNKPYHVTSTEYFKNIGRLNFVCKIHGTEFDARWSDMRLGKIVCKDCNSDRIRREVVSRMGDVQDKIYDFFPNITVDFEGYKNVNTVIKATCDIHNHTWDTTAHYLQLKRGCPICYSDKMSQQNRMSIEELKSKISIGSPNIKVLNIDDYKNTKQKLSVQCIIHGDIFTTTVNSLIDEGNCCEKCKKENRIGDKNPLWNPNLTEEDRINGRKIRCPETGMSVKEWRTQVYERDDYTCDICGDRGNLLNAHHKDGWHWCKDRRFDITNGATLCEQCHKEFHIIFGKSDNTECQYNEFKNIKKSEEPN